MKPEPCGLLHTSKASFSSLIGLLNVGLLQGPQWWDPIAHSEKRIEEKGFPDLFK